MFDSEYLLQQTGGDRDLAQELLHLFLGQLDQLGDHLTQAFAGAPLLPSDLLPLLHRLKGAAVAVGAGECARSIAALETRMAYGPLTQEAADPLRRALDRTSRDISEHLSGTALGSLAKAAESR